MTQLIGGDPVIAETLSSRLLTAFGSIGGVIAAGPGPLNHIINDQDLVRRITAVKPVVLEGMSEAVHRSRFDLSDATLQRWIVGLFHGLRRERVHLALLDGEQRLLFDETFADGNAKCVSGNLRKLVTRGIEVEASSVVLMHNHPSGNVHPSTSDITETRKLALMLENLDFRLEDHLIVSGNAIFSMRGAMLI